MAELSAAKHLASNLHNPNESMYRASDNRFTLIVSLCRRIRCRLRQVDWRLVFRMSYISG